MKVLVTGAAGFIGSHVALRLLERGDEVVGLDNLNAYYDVRLKQARLTRLAHSGKFSFVKAGIEDSAAVNRIFADARPVRVVHLAAQPGVCYSIQDSGAYVASNLVGFANIIEACRHHPVDHLVFASTNSVYGASRQLPFSEHGVTDHPLSFYAATKKANEAMAHSYAHLYGIPCTGLRFFTVYGPWGRPDMALFKFTDAILAGRPIPVYNNGNSSPVNLMRYIEVLETCLGRKAIVDFQPMQPGDVPETYADTTELDKAVGYKPGTPIEVGVKRFADWYLEYQKSRGKG